jgi:hypothetical protein
VTAQRIDGQSDEPIHAGIASSRYGVADRGLRELHPEEDFGLVSSSLQLVGQRQGLAFGLCPEGRATDLPILLQ